MSRRRLTSLETLIRMAGQEVAVGKELKYFWFNKNAVVVKHRRNILRTLLELHSKKRNTDKLETAEGTYQVKEYTVPSIKWLKELVNYSHRIYVTAVSCIDELYMDVETRPLFDESTLFEDEEGLVRSTPSEASQGEILSPEAFMSAMKQISQYNSDWECKSEISKNEICFSDVHGFFKNDGQYVITNRTADRSYSQMLGLTSEMFANFGSEDDALSDEALVRAMTSGVKSQTQDK